MSRKNYKTIPLNSMSILKLLKTNPFPMVTLMGHPQNLADENPWGL